MLPLFFNPAATYWTVLSPNCRFQRFKVCISSFERTVSRCSNKCRCPIVSSCSSRNNTSAFLTAAQAEKLFQSPVRRRTRGELLSPFHLLYNSGKSQNDISSAPLCPSLTIALLKLSWGRAGQGWGCGDVVRDGREVADNKVILGANKLN